MSYDAGKYDVAVIGAGHAGIEAALASARLGCRTVIFTINMDAVGNCPCNPSIGGTAKGHLVREVDALGGEMGKTADECTLQSRMLNLGKGPAVHSLRAQIDRNKYARVMKHKLEQCENLVMRQAEVIDIERDGENWLLTTRLGAVYTCRAVVLATGTFLGGRIFVGEVSYAGGPDGMFPATELAGSLKELGISLRRFKTGTPARVLRSSIDFTDLEVQKGDEPVTPFSFDAEMPPKNSAVCYVSWTNDRTKQVILDNIHRSPLYAGMIEGVGPRYCPSIEAKIVRFADKSRHQLFLEPEGLRTNEIYVQGMSSSLPAEIQVAFMQTIPGLEHCKMMRAGYAIEYDCLDPLQLTASLEHKAIKGLFSCGQANGTSGYEEAAAQGLMAGINAALKLDHRPPFILGRSDAYIGVLIDDLVTKGTTEPYRMMTSRAEYRLLLRQDNADLRLTQKGRNVGLVKDDRYTAFTKKRDEIERALFALSKKNLAPSEENQQKIMAMGSVPLKSSINMMELLRRPEITYEKLQQAFDLEPLSPVAAEEVDVEVKYKGYIDKQKQEVMRAMKLENRLLPDDIDYSALHELSSEAAEKLEKQRPLSIGQASRISGVSPADISVLMVYLESRRRKGEEA